jgi:hypothetical protein
MKKIILLTVLLASLNAHAVPSLELTKFVQGNWWLEYNVTLIDGPEGYRWYYMDDQMVGHGNGDGFGWRGFLMLDHFSSTPGEHVAKVVIDLEEGGNLTLTAAPFTILEPTGERPSHQIPIPTPDGGSTLWLFGAGIVALIGKRQFTRPLIR